MGYTEKDVQLIREKAKEIRRDSIYMIHKAGAGHPGGSLSAADIIAALYYTVLRIDPANPDWPDRDRLILSKGHCCPALYAALCGRGYFGREQLELLRRLILRLQQEVLYRNAAWEEAFREASEDCFFALQEIASYARCLRGRKE